MATRTSSFGLNPLDAAIDEVRQRYADAPAPTVNAPGLGGVDTRQPNDVRFEPKAGDYTPPAALRPLFESTSRKYDVPVNVLMALASQESNYNDRAVGVETEWGRAQGMMQYLDATAKNLGINPFDPRQAVDAAAMQIRQRLDKGYSIEDAVKEHFAGPNRKLWGKKTAQYGIDVLGRAKSIADAMYGQPQAGMADKFNAMIDRGSQTGGNMSTVQDGPMSVPAGTLDKDIAPTNTPEYASEPAEQVDSRIAAQAGIDVGYDSSHIDQSAGAASFGRLGERVSGGFAQMGNSLAVTRAAVGGDWDQSTIDTITNSILESQKNNEAKQTNLHPQEKNIEAGLKRFGDSEGVMGTLAAAGDLAWTAATNPIGLGLGTAEQAANMAPTIAGGMSGAVTGAGVGAAAGSIIPGAGTAAGAATGAVWGSRTGMMLGTAALEYGNELQEAVQEALKATNARPTKENIAKVLSDPGFKEQAQKQAAIKGLTLAAVDALTFKLAGSVGKKSLDKTASTGARVRAGAGSTAIEFAGEPAGEAISQLAARGTIDKADVAAEALYGTGTSMATAGASTGISAAGQAAKGMRSPGEANQPQPIQHESIAPNGDRVRWEETPDSDVPPASGPMARAMQHGEEAAQATGTDSPSVPPNAPAIGEAVIVQAEGLDPIQGIVEGYADGEVIVQAAGESLQVPLEAITPANAPTGIKTADGTPITVPAIQPTPDATPDNAQPTPEKAPENAAQEEIRKQKTEAARREELANPEPSEAAVLEAMLNAPSTAQPPQVSPSSDATAAQTANDASENGRLDGKRAAYKTYKSTGAPDDVVAASVSRAQEKANSAGAPLNLWQSTDGGAIALIPAESRSPFKNSELIATFHPEEATEQKSVTPKPKTASKEDAEHLFGVDQKRAAALKRIDAGRAWFSEKAKAQGFITKNGLTDTHEPVQTGAKRWEPKAKGDVAAKPAPAAAPQDNATPKPAATDDKAKWIKALIDKSRLNGSSGVQITVGADGNPTFLGDPNSSKDSRALLATYEKALESGATKREIADAIRAAPQPVPTDAAGEQWTRSTSNDRQGFATRAGLSDKVANTAWADLTSTVRKKLAAQMAPEAQTQSAAEQTSTAPAATWQEREARAQAQAKKENSERAKPAAKLDAAATAIDAEIDKVAGELAAMLKAQRGQLNSGIDPQLLALGAKLGALYVSKGVVKFAQYARAIIDKMQDLGVDAEQVKPLLKEFYGATMMKVDDATLDKMDGVRTVRSFNLDNLGAEDTTEQAEPVETKTVVTPAGREFEVRYRVVEADSLVTSNLDDGRVNPAYPEALQPRDRSRAASEIQINDIAARMNPKLLGESTSTADGAPIASDAGIVESGNGRTLAIKRAYARHLDTAQAYRDWLAGQGYDVAGMTAPVLVRERATAMTQAELEAYTAESNERTTLQMSPSEQSEADAKLIGPLLSDYAGGDVGLARNRDFVRHFIRTVVSRGDQGGMVGADGILTQDGKRRIEAAMMAAAYDSPEIVNDLFESTEEGFKNIGNALIEAAGQWAIMRRDAASGAINPAVDHTKNLVEAVNIVRKAKAIGKSVHDVANQNDIFSGEPDRTTLKLLASFFRGDRYTGTRSKDAIADFLLGYARLAQATQAGANMFGEAPVSGDQILDELNDKRKQNETPAEQSGLAFGVQPDEPGVAGDGGQARGQGAGTQDTAGNEAGSAAEGVTPAGNAVDFFYARVKAGDMPTDNNARRKLAAQFYGGDVDNAKLKEAQEDIEAAIARYARDLVAQGGDTRAVYDRLLNLYASQPNLNIRTSTSIENQAYSTPAPLAYLAAKLASIGADTTVYEPTAGNGMLLITADVKNATANELNDQRYANLLAQGFDAMQGDALDVVKSGAVGEKTQAALITNPPFGSVKDADGKATKVLVDGYQVGKIDHLIAAESLKTLRDDGKAVLIIGADKVAGGLSKDDRIFFNWLYSHYNVTGHFEVDGKLYSRQGAGWPVRVISINGRKESSQTSPRSGTINRADTWEKVYEQFEQSLVSQDAGIDADAAGRTDGPMEGRTGGDDPLNASGSSGRTASEGDQGGRGRSPRGAGNVGRESSGNGGDLSGQRTGSVGDSDRTQRHSGRPDSDGRVGQGGQGSASADARASEPTGNARSDAVNKLTSSDNSFQSGYTPASSRKDEGVLIPVNMAQPLRNALAVVEDTVGNIDEFAAKELGYPSIAKLHDALMGLQVDSVATAIRNMKDGKGTIIADQTGIGKGRQAAAIIRWAIRNGKTPVFMTMKPQLFSDMYADLLDIGSDDVSPFIVNLDESITTPTGQKVFANKKATHRRDLGALASGGALPEGTNAVFLTYSQINKKGNIQQELLSTLAPNAVFVLDESHNAGGASSTGEFMSGVLENASAVVYLSATYAKRPDNMPVYFRTDIGAAIADSGSLMRAMADGGLPLQTVVANNLVAAGQMFRRERSYDGVDIATVVDSGNRAAHERLSDSVTAALRAVVAADESFHQNYFASIVEQLKEEGKTAYDNVGNQASESVVHTEFSSVVHNFVRQLLLGLKADAAADAAIAALKRNEKPLIALENTMGSFLASYAEGNNLRIGQNIGAFDYRTVLSRALDRTRYIATEDKQGNKTKEWIPLEKLDAQSREAYRAAQETIDALDVAAIPVSPLDWIRHRITQAGYTIGEITGRDMAVDYSSGEAVLSQIPLEERKDKVATTRRFNSGEMDAIILNVSGSTGISLHASERFKDKRKRHMIVAQAAQDINVFMQMLGRVHRTGQVVVPGYSLLNVDLPAEKRPTAILAGKMKSLNANTSSNTESATSVKSVDMLNKYGDQIIGQYLGDNAALAKELGLEGSVDSEGGTAPDIARKATGRMALMPVQTQKDFYADVEEQYSALIDYLNKTGQNELEPRTLDYDARETHRQTLVPETGPSPFEAAAEYVELSIKAQGSPMTPDEIRAEMDENLAGMKPGQHVTALIETLENAYASADTSLAGSLGIRQNGKNFINQHGIGTTWRVEINGDIFNAVVTNLKSSHKGSGNPYSLSKIQATLALNGSLRRVVVPASQFKRIEVASLGAQRIETLFQAKPANERETAKVIAGNLLAGYGEMNGSSGTIVNYTKSDGSIEQAILLPKSFDVAKHVYGDYRFRRGADVVKFLQGSTTESVGRYGIMDRNSEVRVKLNDGDIEIYVPKSKARGGKFFLDDKIRAVVGDFVSKGSSMVASVAASKAAPAIDALINKVALYAPPSVADEASQLIDGRALNGPAVSEPSPEYQAQAAGAVTDTPAFRKWFGDSKIVDADGAPLVAYHGSHEQFNKFDLPENDHWTGPGDNDVKRAGIAFFSSDRATARTYGKHVMEVFLSLKNPFIVDAKGQTYKEFVPYHFVGKALAAGHDGVIVRNIRDDAKMKGKVADTFIVLDRAQIKSATGNNGNFDPANESIISEPATAKQLYANIETRPNTTQKQLELGFDAVESLARRFLGFRADNAGASVLGSRLVANFRAGKPNQLVGQVAKTPADLAALAQVYRDPRFETFRVVFTDADGKVVGESGYTSRLPAQVSLPESIFADIEDGKKRFKAKGYAIMHNHPSGNATPSGNDLAFTRTIAEKVPGFTHHVVIDSNEYAVINKDGEHMVIKDRTLNATDFTAAPELEHELLGVSVTDPLSAVRMAKALQVPGGHATLVMTTSPGRVQVIIDVPMAMLADTSEPGIRKATAFVRRVARANGAGGSRFLVLPAGQSVTDSGLSRLVTAGLLTDIVSADGNTARSSGVLGSADPLNRNAKTLAVSEPSRKYAPKAVAKAVSEKTGSKLTDLTPKALAFIPLNYFTDFAQRNMTAVKDYIRLKREMDAYRGEKHHEANEVSQEWLKYVALDRHGAKALADLMHDTTQTGTDPSITSEGASAQPDYKALRRRFLDLSPKGQDLYTTVRDTYRKQSIELDQILIDNIGKAVDSQQVEAERAYNREIARIRDEGLEGADKTKAEAEALKDFRTASTKAKWRGKARQTEMRRTFESNRVSGPYFPLNRVGTYFVTVRDAKGKVISFSLRETHSDREALADALRQAHPYGAVETGVLSNKDAVREAMDPRFVAGVEQILADAGVDDAVRDQIWQRYLSTLPDLSMRKRFIHRKGMPGFDTDAYRAFGRNMFHGAHQMARIKYGIDMQEALNRTHDQARQADNRDKAQMLANEMELRHKWVMNPSGNKVSQFASSLAFVWYLGVTPAAALVNLSQTVILGVPIMGSKFGFAKAQAALLKAGVDFGRGKGSVTGAALTSDEQAAFVEFYNAGLLDRSQAHDLAGVGETGVEYSAVREKAMGIISFAFHHAERFNREVTALAAYRLARDAGQSHEQAIDSAMENTWKTHFDYSNSNRPRIMQNDWAKVLLVFKNFQINMLYRLFRDIHQSIKGESPAVRKEARIQLAGLVGMMALNGGIKGMYFYSIAMLLASFFLGDDDDPWEFEDKFRAGTIESMQRVFGDERGKTVAGMVLNGIPGHLLGVDLTNRIGMPDLWFRSPYKEMEGKEIWQYYSAQFLGAVPSIAESMFRGWQLAMDGHVARGIETAAPKVIKDQMKAWRYAQEGATTIKGDSLAPEISAKETIGQAIGFTPAVVSETYERNNALRNAQDKIKSRKANLLDRRAMAAKAGDKETLAEIDKKIKEFNANPHHKNNRITGPEKIRSLRARDARSRRSVDGVVLDKKLDRQLRGGMPDYIYR